MSGSTPGAPMEEEFTFKCTSCGETHAGYPDLAYDAPYYYDERSDGDRPNSAVLTSETCVLDGTDYFIRGRLEIPVHGRTVPFAYGVWVSLSEKSFARYQELFKSTELTDEPPFFGWFSNAMAGYPDTLGLKTNVHLRPFPQRPSIELQPTDHPLALEQRNGISEDRLRAIIQATMHAGDDE